MIERYRDKYTKRDPCRHRFRLTGIVGEKERELKIN